MVLIASIELVYHSTQMAALSKRQRVEWAAAGTAGGSRPGPPGISAKIIVWRFDGRMAFVPEGQHDIIVAWHEVPGIMRKIAPSRRDD